MIVKLTQIDDQVGVFRQFPVKLENEALQVTLTVTCFQKRVRSKINMNNDCSRNQSVFSMNER